jgi:hypothetical protein
MSDIVERLRSDADYSAGYNTYALDPRPLYREAADEIERLRAALLEIRALGDVRADEAGMIAERALEQKNAT